MFIPHDSAILADTVRSQWHQLRSRSISDDTKSPSFPIPGIIGVTVGGGALLLVAAFLVILNCLKRRDKMPQTSVSSMSGQPLLVSSGSVSQRETTTDTNSQSNKFSSRGPATTYGSRVTTSGSRFQPMIIGPATQILGGSARRHDEDPVPIVFAAPATRTTRSPPRKTSRWSHLPPIPTIREASEPDSLRGAAQYLAGTSSGTHPVATRQTGPNLSIEDQLSRVDTTTRTRPTSVIAAAEGSAGTGVDVHSMDTASAKPHDEMADEIVPAGDAPSAPDARTRTISSTSSQFSVASYPALGKVSKPRATYARPGRLISGRGQPSA